MAEKVETGGMISFDYKGAKLDGKLSEGERREIQLAYEQANLRKAREKRNKIIIWIVIGLIIVVGVGLIFLK